MKIGINLLFLIPGKVGGTEVFARNVVEFLSEIDKKNEYVLFLNKENSNFFKKLPKNFSRVVCKFDAVKRFKRVIWEQLILPIQCYNNKIDLLHSLGYTSPLFTHCPKITTIYDLNYHYFPEDFSFANLSVFRILIPLVARFSNKVVVHSYKTKRDMVKVLGIDKDKIEVEYGGVSNIFRKKVNKNMINRTMKKYKISEPFIFSAASASHPHKNLKSLVFAYEYLLKRYNVKQKLVLLGFPGRGQVELNNLLLNDTLKSKVIFTGWVDPIDMPSFYKAADLFVFPSLYEGFGLPLVESMAAGIPLITSKTSCIPEIVENGGLLIDTRNYKKMGDSIYRVLNNKRLANKLIANGIKRSNYFKWDRLAKFYLKLYEKETN